MTSEAPPHRLPAGWAILAAQEACEKIQDGTHFSPKVQMPDGRYRYLTAKNIRPSGLALGDVTYLREDVHRAIYARCDTRKGDVLLVKDGVNAGDAALNTLDDEVSLLSSVCFLRPRRFLTAAFLRYYLLSPLGARSLTDKLTGTAIRRIVLQRVRALPVVIAPLREQQHLVDTIDSYLSRLDEAEAALKRVQRNLKRYRAAVLRAAVEGRLVPTEADLARADDRDYESASELLKRVLAERRRRWEAAELARLRAAGKGPKDDRWKGKYEDVANPPTDSLATLPKGWCWTTVDSLADVKGGITKNQARRSTEPLRRVPYLRVANVQRGSLDLSEMATIPATAAEIEELRLLAGDVLFNEGGDRDKLGRGWIWRGQLPECIHQNHVFRARLRTPDVFPEYMSWYGNTGGQKYFFEQGKQTTNLASINLTKLKRLPVPLPPLMEQRRIVAEVQRLLSIAGETAQQVDAGLQRCRRLRQSILKWAFEGKLVDQDPNDEPVSVLLERIRTERPAQDQTLVVASRSRKTTMR